MSLIDEALKRARDQKPAEAGAEAPRSRRTPDPWAYAPLPHARRRGPARGWVIAGSIGAVAAVAVFGVWLSRSRETPVRAADPPRSSAGNVGGVSSAAPAPEVPTASPPAPAVPPAREGRPPSREAPATKLRPVAASPPGAPAARVREPGTSRAEEAAASRTEIAPPRVLPQPASRALDGRTYVGALVAPNGARVELGGIVYSETNSSALLNGRILPVGGVVEGLTISSIEEDRVELTGDGLTVHLTLR